MAIDHVAIEQTSTLKEFAEQTTVPTRMLYAAPHRRTGHRLAALDVPTPVVDARARRDARASTRSSARWTSSPSRAGIDPIELRVRNEPETRPRDRAARSAPAACSQCMREGAERFGWADRDPTPGVAARRPLARRHRGRRRRPTRRAARRRRRSPARTRDGTFVVGIGAADIGTGARTVLTQIAADALEVPLDRVRVDIGDSDLPTRCSRAARWARPRGARRSSRRSPRCASRSTPTTARCPTSGLEAQADTADDIKAAGAVRPPRVRRAVLRGARERRHRRGARARGCSACSPCGRILNPLTAALAVPRRHDAGDLDGAARGERARPRVRRLPQPRLRAVPRRRSFADIEDIEATWIEEDDPHLNPMGAKGIGEIGIVGTAAAVANAVFHATGVRVRDLPIRLDRVLGRAVRPAARAAMMRGWRPRGRRRRGWRRWAR